MKKPGRAPGQRITPKDRPREEKLSCMKSLMWDYDIPPGRTSELLTEDLISKLRFDWLKKQYTFIKNELPRSLQTSR